MTSVVPGRCPFGDDVRSIGRVAVDFTGEDFSCSWQRLQRGQENNVARFRQTVAG